MKTPILFLISALILHACTSDPKTSEPYKQLEEDHDRTEHAVETKDSTINAVFRTFNQISDNLRAIRSKQGGLMANGTSAESKAGLEERIMTDIADIDRLLTENHALIGKLRSQAKASAGRINELERAMTDMEQTLTEKDEEIGKLKEQLASTNSSLATLIEMYRDKSQLADMQRNALNTAYYAVGTAKELKEKGVLTKEGGMVGLGAVNKLNTAALPKDYFSAIDITNTQEIVVGGKRAKLATAHPDGSYRLVEGSTKLTILDPEKFWSISKYLVVVVD